MVTYTPGSRAIDLSFRHLRGLAVDAGLHDVVLADGAVVYMDVPSPQSYVPVIRFDIVTCRLCRYSKSGKDGKPTLLRVQKRRSHCAKKTSVKRRRLGPDLK